MAIVILYFGMSPIVNIFANCRFAHLSIMRHLPSTTWGSFLIFSTRVGVASTAEAAGVAGVPAGGAVEGAPAVGTAGGGLAGVVGGVPSSLDKVGAPEKKWF